MTSDAIIEAAARRLHEAESPRVSWDGAPAAWRATCRAGAHALAAAALLVDELPPDPLPAGQVRREPDTSDVWHRIGKADEWFCAHPDIDIRLTDDDVRDWPTLVPETHLDEVRAARDRLADRVAELEAADGCAVDADALAQVIYTSWKEWLDNFDERGQQALIADTIRDHLPAATRPALPEGRVAVDLRDVPSDLLSRWIPTHRGNTSVAVAVMSRVADAELARRAAEGGVSS